MNLIIKLKYLYSILVHQKCENENLVSNGGRVLSITSIGENVQVCRQKAYGVVETINWKQGFYRRDIGKL